MNRFLQHLQSWCMGYILLILIAICAIKGKFGVIKGIGVFAGIATGWVALMFLIGFIYRLITREKPKAEKTLHFLIVLVVATWLFYGSVLSFIDAKTTKRGAYVTSESGEEWWASKSQLKRESVVNGSMLFFLGCGAAWYCWQVLTKKEESHAEEGLYGFEEGLHDEDG